MTEIETPEPSEASVKGAVMSAVGLTRHFSIGGTFSKQVLHAVDDFSFSISEREIVAVVGESGSGKTTLVRLLAKVFRPTSGEIVYKDRSVRSLRSRKDVLWYRGEVPMVFQDPYSSMNPVYRVSHGVMRNLKLHRRELNTRERWAEAQRVFDTVGLDSSMLEKFPYEMSGGQRQRVGFAQSLAARPKLILADEPVSMLDVSIRAGILNMMSDLREKEDVSILYITHDVASARYVADRVIVMYAGHQVESGPTDEIISNPKHPYTQLLLSAVSDLGETTSLVTGDTGEPPKVVNPSEGCRFRWRCPYVVDECGRTTPKLRRVGLAHEVACHVASADPVGEK